MSGAIGGNPTRGAVWVVGLAGVVGALMVVSPAVIALAVAAGIALALAAVPTLLLVTFVGVSIFANYLSSWLPSLGAYPAGALIRDLLALLFLGVAAAHLTRPYDGRAHLPARRPLSLAERHVILSLLLFLGAWTFAVLVFDPEPLLGVYAVRNIVLYVGVGIAAFAMFERDYLNARVAGDAVLALGVVAGAIGILDSITDGRILDVLGYDPDYANVGGPRPVGEEVSFFGYDRASGGVTNAVTFGYLAALVAVYALYRLLNDRGRRGQRVLGLEAAALVAGGLGCVLSLTRGALVALALSAVIVTLAAPASRWRVAVILAGVAVAAVVAVAAGGPGAGSIFGQRVTSGDVASKLSSEQRREELDYGIDVLERHPLGVGLASFGKAASRYAQRRASTVSYEVQHVPLLGFAFQLGVVGLVALLALLVAIARNGAVNVRRGGALPLCAIVIYVAALLLGTGGEEPVSAVPLYVLLALFLARPLDPRPPIRPRGG